jgi:hypothetical protein
MWPAGRQRALELLQGFSRRDKVDPSRGYGSVWELRDGIRLNHVAAFRDVNEKQDEKQLRLQTQFEENKSLFETDSQLDQLEGMGFPRPLAGLVLQQAKGNVKEAIDILLKGVKKVELASHFALQVEVVELRVTALRHTPPETELCGLCLVLCGGNIDQAVELVCNQLC